MSNILSRRNFGKGRFCVINQYPVLRQRIAAEWISIPKAAEKALAAYAEQSRYSLDAVGLNLTCKGFTMVWSVFLNGLDAKLIVVFLKAAHGIGIY